MKIIIYCQHVLGVGHFFRTLEICRALEQHQVVLVSGGPETPAPLPPHVRRLQLPELAMDHAFQNLHATDGQSVTQTRASRRAMLEHLFREERPDLFLIELYPLGRKAFRDELDPVLAQIKDGRLPPCRVVCSVRDILVEKVDQTRHEMRAAADRGDGADTLLSLLLVAADQHDLGPGPGHRLGDFTAEYARAADHDRALVGLSDRDLWRADAVALVDTGHRQTALVHRFFSLLGDDLRVDQRQRLTAVFRGVDHDHTAQIVDLHRSQTDSGCGIHGLEHVIDELAQLVIHGLDAAMGIKKTILPYIVFVAGLTGTTTGILLQWWTNAIDYPFLISGKPLFSLPANIPVAFETTILFAAISALVGMLAFNGLPQLSHPLHGSRLMKRATDDSFLISIEAADPNQAEDVAAKKMFEMLANDEDDHVRILINQYKSLVEAGKVDLADRLLDNRLSFVNRGQGTGGVRADI